jgi:hypothetical protein
MTDPHDETKHPELYRLFTNERSRIKADPVRIARISHRIHQESSLNDLGLMIFARFWIALLQMGAIFYVTSIERQHMRKTNRNPLRQPGQS